MSVECGAYLVWSLEFGVELFKPFLVKWDLLNKDKPSSRKRAVSLLPIYSPRIDSGFSPAA